MKTMDHLSSVAALLAGPCLGALAADAAPTAIWDGGDGQNSSFLCYGPNSGNRWAATTGFFSPLGNPLIQGERDHN